MSNIGEITHNLAAERLAAGISMYAGRGRRFSIDGLADAAGWSPSAMEKAAAGTYTPGLGALLRLQAVLPPAFTNHLIEPAGLGGARRLDAGAKAASLVLAELTAEAAIVAKALTDGRVDHIERAELRRRLPQLIETLTQFQVALGKDA